MTLRFLLDLYERDGWTEFPEAAKLTPGQRRAIKGLMLLDLDRLFPNLSDFEKREVVANLMRDSLPERMKEFERVNRDVLRAPKTLADYFILCVVPVELMATLLAFGIDPDAPPNREYQGHKFYHTTLVARGGKKLSIWIGSVGEARNVPCAAFLATMYSMLFDFRKTILVGISGGNRKLTKLGDVVASDHVLDLEGGRLEPPNLWERVVGKEGHHQLRLEVVKCEGALANSIRSYSFNERAVNDAATAITSNNANPRITFAPSIPFSNVQLAWIQSGEQVDRSGTLPRNSRTYHDKLAAVEMEGMGFAIMCKSLGLDWMIFRGVSDFGDRHKGDRMQSTAALMAALYARAFVVDHEVAIVA